MPLLRLEAAKHTGTSAPAYTKALDALQAYFNSTDSSAEAEFPSTRTAADWLVHMHLRGLSPKTIRFYLDIAASLHSAAAKSGRTPATSVFKTLKAKLRLVPTAASMPFDAEAAFQRLATLTRAAHNHTGEHAIAVDIVLGSILLGLAPLGTVAATKTDQTDALGPQWADIAARHASHRRKYIFPLGQPDLTPRQLARKTDAIVAHLLSSQGITPSADPADTLAAIWAHAALRCGATGSQIIAILGNAPTAQPLLTLCTPAPVPAGQKQKLIAQVAQLFTANPLRWYAMRLRPHTSFGHLTQRLHTLQATGSPVPETFYPCDEIRRRTRAGRLATEQRPVLPDIVFFRTRLTQIQPLFAHIGDLAWCYTTGTGTYAPMAAAQFAAFQRAIAHFTPDYEVAPGGTLPLRPGDQIIVLGGPLAGLHGTLLATPGTLYRVHLFGPNHTIEWRLRDPRLLAPNPPSSQPQTLKC